MKSAVNSVEGLSAVQREPSASLLAIVLATLAIALVLASAMASTARAAPGDLVHTTIAAEPPGVQKCPVNIGIAFDGTDLLVSCRDSHRIDFVNPISGSLTRPSLIVQGIQFLGALAFDASTAPTAGKVWACTSAASSKIELIDPNNNGALSNPIVIPAAAAGAPPTPGCYDGLAFDADAPKTLYHSADNHCRLGHSRITPAVAIPIAPFPKSVCVPPLFGGGGNSGLAVGGPDLYMGTYDAKQIYLGPKGLTPAPTLFRSVPNGPEDMECDNVTFAPMSVIWVIERETRVLRAYEIPKGSCNYGGVAAKGTLKVCKVAGKGIAPYGTGTPPASTSYTFRVNGGPPFTVPAGPGPDGYCYVAGSFDPGQVVTVEELLSVGSGVADITVDPSPRLVTGSKDLTGQKVKVTIGANDVTHVTFTDKKVPTGFIEICKKTSGHLLYPLPVFFDFAVPGIAGLVRVPPGACSPAIMINAGPAVTITEQPPFGFKISGCTTVPPGGVSTGNSATIKVIASTMIMDQTILTCTNVTKPSLPSPPIMNAHLTSGVVKKVVDSKTLRVETARKRQSGLRKVETVSLLGLESPSFTRLDAAQQCGGLNATNAMLHVAFGDRAVDTDADGLEDDTRRAGGLLVLLDTTRARPRRDRSGRLLAYVLDSRTLDDLGRRTITEGWARRSGIKRGSSRFERYGRAQAKARKAKRGVWSQCGGDFQLDVPAPEPEVFEDEAEGP
jgi:endonuclease YncB( thermonuclease family)